MLKTKIQEKLIRSANKGKWFVAAGKMPYETALWLFEAEVQSKAKNKVKIWARNSFIQDSFVPFLSDLDSTAYFFDEPAEEDLQMVIRSQARIKKWWPFMGEMNLYFQREVLDFMEVANPLELRRDPKLLEIAGLQMNRSLDWSDKLAFLLRMAEADLKNLTKWPELRVKKWKGHFDAVGQKYPNHLTWENLVSEICDLLPESSASKEAAHDMIRRHWTSYLAGEALHSTKNLNNWAMVLFPNRFCYMEPPRNLELPSMEKLLRAQLGWEIWGLYGQIRLGQLSNLEIHLQNLIHFTQDRVPSNYLRLLRRLVDISIAPHKLT